MGPYNQPLPTPANPLQRMEAGLKLVHATFAAMSGPQFLGLNATFGCHTQDTPDVVVCDFASPGCHDFARHVGASLVLNVPDAYSSINFVSVDAATPSLQGALSWPVISREVLEAAREQQSSLTLGGVVARSETRAIRLVFHTIMSNYLSHLQQEWRPSGLPVYVKCLLLVPCATCVRVAWLGRCQVAAVCAGLPRGGVLELLCWVLLVRGSGLAVRKLRWQSIVARVDAQLPSTHPSVEQSPLPASANACCCKHKCVCVDLQVFFRELG